MVAKLKVILATAQKRKGAASGAAAAPLRIPSAESGTASVYPLTPVSSLGVMSRVPVLMTFPASKSTAWMVLVDGSVM
jgi:hypothetical protein